jgi:acetyl esterase
MNWKIKLVLLFGKLRKPIDPDNATIHSLRSKANRAVWYGNNLFDKKLQVKYITDTHADSIPVRIYRNSDAPAQRVIIYYHGGGFVLYGIKSHDNVCRRLCKMNNCVVVSVDYRLAPEHTFPAAHEDAFTAIKWVRKNIAQYGGNPDDLVVAGDSAGGNLAACMAHRCKKENIPLTAQILIYPWIDGAMNNPSIERNGKGHLLEKETMFWFQQQYTPNKEDYCRPEVSPCYEKDFTGLAPAFMLTAELDPLLDDGYKYFQQLKSAGNKGCYEEYKGLFHSFFNLPGVHPIAMKSYHDIREFLNGLSETKEQSRASR